MVERNPDLIVVGAGAAGMACALVAALNGLKVTLLEASDQVGGTTATSAGTLWVPGNSLAQAAGCDDSIAAAEAYLEALIGTEDPGGLRCAYLRSAAEAIDYLQANSWVKFRSAGTHPDYLELPGAASAGRAISPLDFDGRLLGKEFARVRPPMPQFMVLGGMMVGKADVTALLGRMRSLSNFAHSTRLVGRYAWDRLSGYGRGTRLVMGNALVARLLYSLMQAGVDIRYETHLEGLLTDSSRVAGARVRHQGATKEIYANNGVVLCAGGIGHSIRLREEFGAHALDSLSLSHAGNLGRGIEAARELGAALLRSTPDFLWQPVSTVPSMNGRPASLYPHLYLDRAKPGLLAVDGNGCRFVNEGASYHHFVEGMLHARQSPQQPATAFLICSTDFIRQYGLGAIHPGTSRLKPWIRSGYIAVEETLDALSLKLGIDSRALHASAAQMNAAAASGHDPAFGKGATIVSRFNGDPRHFPNPCLGVIRQGPYVGLRIRAGESASSSGLRTTADCEVLDTSGKVMAGLFACGNDMASIWRGAYPGPGATLGPAIVFAYRLVLGLLASR